MPGPGNGNGADLPIALAERLRSFIIEAGAATVEVCEVAGYSGLRVTLTAGRKAVSATLSMAQVAALEEAFCGCRIEAPDA